MKHNLQTEQRQRPLDDFPAEDVANVATIAWNIRSFGSVFVGFDSEFMRAAMILVERGSVVFSIDNFINGLLLTTPRARAKQIQQSQDVGFACEWAAEYGASCRECSECVRWQQYSRFKTQLNRDFQFNYVDRDKVIHAFLVEANLC